jgi:hypothetical protein
MMGVSSDARFLKRARKELAHLFPLLPNRSGYLKRRQRLSDTIEWLTAVFASDSPGFHDDLVLVDSTPVECARSVETTRRSALADAADYGYCVSHSRYFWGFRLHGLFALDGTPRAALLTSPQTRTRLADPTSRRSGNGSNRSSRPAKTCSPSNATAPAPCTASAPESECASSPSPPHSASTTASADPHAHSSTTPPEPVEQVI